MQHRCCLDPPAAGRHWIGALQHRENVEIDIILSPKQAQNFRDRINADGTDAHAIDEALAHVQSENAEASVQADLDAIRALIQQYSGGFGTLDDTVRQYLRRWFVSQGGVKVVARHRSPIDGAEGSRSTDQSRSRAKEERVRTRSQEDAESPFAASTVSAPGHLKVLVEGAQRDGGGPGGGGPDSPILQGKARGGTYAGQRVPESSQTSTPPKYRSTLCIKLLLYLKKNFLKVLTNFSI